MSTNTNEREDSGDPRIEADRVVRDLAKVAFGNMADFVQFDKNGIVSIDYDKAREAGAIVSVVTRKVGRGKNARTVRSTKIQLPYKLRALVLLGKHLGLLKTRRRRLRTR